MQNDEAGKAKLIAALSEFQKVRQQAQDALESLVETRERERQRLDELFAIATAQVRHYRQYGKLPGVQ